jgi:hypothetical protein
MALVSLEVEARKGGKVVQARGGKIKFLKVMLYLMRKREKEEAMVSLGFGRRETER